MNEQVKKEFEKIWKAIEEIRKSYSRQKPNTPKTIKKNYKGLVGGICLLIDEDFINIPKSIGEIYKELKRQGYHYSKTAVDKLIRVNFMKDKKILTRVKESKVWKYVIRK